MGPGRALLHSTSKGASRAGRLSCTGGSGKGEVCFSQWQGLICDGKGLCQKVSSFSAISVSFRGATFQKIL